MIISHGRRYIFVHIPKTGGTSLALALESRAKADDILIGDTPKARQRRGRLQALRPAGRLWKHSTLADIDGIIGRAELETYFIVTLVRNPWDRVVSYYHWLRAQRFDHPAVGLAQSVGFADFVRAEQTIASLRANSYGSYVRAADGVEHCTAFVRLEHLADDIAGFERHLGFGLRQERSNASDRQADYRGYYDDTTANIVAQACAVDIARFGYAFDPPQLHRN